MHFVSSDSPPLRIELRIMIAKNTIIPPSMIFVIFDLKKLLFKNVFFVTGEI